MIMRETVACRLPRRTLLAIGALALLALPGFTLGQDKSKSNDPPSEKKEAPAASKPGIGVIWADFDGDGKVEIILQDELFDLIDRQPEDRDKKLAELEARVQAMLKEIQELKGKPAGQLDTKRQIESALKYLRTIQAEKDWTKNYSSTAHGLAALALAQAHSHRIETAPNSVTLLRVTYLLPPGKAPALAALLKDHAKATPLEANVEGDKLVVTASPDNQRVIHAVINLMQDSVKPK